MSFSPPFTSRATRGRIEGGSPEIQIIDSKEAQAWRRRASFLNSGARTIETPLAERLSKEFLLRVCQLARASS